MIIEIPIKFKGMLTVDYQCYCGGDIINIDETSEDFDKINKMVENGTLINLSKPKQEKKKKTSKKRKKKSNKKEIHTLEPIGEQKNRTYLDAIEDGFELYINNFPHDRNGKIMRDPIDRFISSKEVDMN